MSEKQTQSKSTTKNLVAGGTAGAIEVFIMYPTEFVKTQLQLQAKGQKQGTPPKYAGIFDCAKKTIQEKGAGGLYRGMSTLIIGSIPKAAVRFAAFEKMKTFLADEQGKMTPTANMMAGMGAGLCEAVVAVTPMETIKTKMIHDQSLPTPRYKGMMHGVKTMIAEEGLGSIYKGLVPTMAKQGCNQAVRFSSFNFLKDTYKAHFGANPNPVLNFGMGMVAGFLSVYATMPFDVVKTQMQGLESKAYSSSLQCGLAIARTNGVLALWKGTVPRLGRVCFSGGIIFTAYEEIMKIILTVVPDN